ncbi:RICIN domain-containing protein [Streptomyces sp. H39-C1]|uniref:RICIN domain-containing protein n=1 Tax=Streptomyces sp. H39-C1 TaxID=3004355 RepID=UPI0022AEED73|nr:RICIN domain-containing protein [Streptomyces sp. H39-C1]MCZ4098416.1 family 20 glycosylhydrolase [Streptomyces sp. H39-C1]
MRPLRTLAAAALAASLVPVYLLAAAPATHAATGTPTTVPSLRSWTAGTGSFSFISASRVVVDPAYAAQLTADANTFAADLSALEGRTVAVVQGAAGVGDIALTLGGNGLPAEGYTMTVGSSISIQGGTTTGEFWGTRTVLQMLHQGSTITAGTATDSPTKAERGLMIDAGRRFFDVPFVENQIRDMAYLKMNYLHLHLSDTFGFRLESSTHPEVTSTQHYSKQDIADIIAVGNKYHVTIVPEIDMPGHMDAILTGELNIGHDYRLKDSSGGVSSAFIDLSIPGARTLISDLINEYLPLFASSRYWHIGADEYVTNYSAYPQLLTYARANYGASATAKDTYYGFINWADSLVKTGAKTTRMWNDGIKAGDGTISPNADIVVEYWYNYGLTPQQLINAGHTVANESWDPTYYVYGGSKPNTTWMYETWNPDLFQGGNTINSASKNLGSLLHVWCDNPSAETQDQTAAGIKYPMRDLAQMTWGTPELAATYAAFVPIMDAVGRNPLWPGSGTGNLNGVHTLTTGGKALDDPGGSTTTGTQLITWALHGGANQQWTFTQQSDGSYTLVNGTSGLCADVNGGSTAAGAKIIQWTCSGTTNQEWTVTPLAGGGYTVKSVKSGLLLTTASTADGALLTQQADTNSALQHWTIG